MFPVLVPPPVVPATEEESVTDAVSPPAPGTKLKGAALFPSVVRRMQATYTPLEHIDQLIPVINKEIRESRSKAAHDILVRMAINNKLLFYELSAVRIQALVRQFIAKLRIQRIRRRLELFMRVTEECAARYLEEFVLATCLEMSLGFYRQHRRFKLLQDSVEREIEHCIMEMQEEVVTESIAEVAKETISDAINVVVQMRHTAHLSQESKAPKEAQPSPTKPVKQNPLVVLVNTVVEDAVTAFMRTVASEAVMEEAQEYLLQQKCDRIYAIVVTTCMLEALQEDLQMYLGEVITNTTVVEEALYERIYSQQRKARGANSPTARAGRVARRSTFLQMPPKT